jgi:iron complex outermembrane receptor protein
MRVATTATAYGIGSLLDMGANCRGYTNTKQTSLGRSAKRLAPPLGILLACTALYSTAFAEPNAKAEAPAVSEVVVTAQHRVTKLQETPVAESVVSGLAIQEQRIINLIDVAAKVPSTTFDQHSRSESYISIRGTTIGNDAAGIDQGVTVFIDDVPTTGFGDDSPDLYDLSSVEVLRGPQGTLFGRNVTGGAILIRSLPPSFNFAAQGTLTYGSNNLMEAQSLVTGPIVEGALAGKISFDLRRRDAWQRNVFLNSRTGAEDVGSIRGQLMFAPTNDFQLTLGADYLDDTSSDKEQYLLGNYQPGAPFPKLNFSPTVTNQGIAPSMDKKVGGALAKAEWNLHFATLTSISGFRGVNEKTHFSTSGDPLNMIISDPIVRDDQLTEELRLTSPSDQPLTWTAGAFFLHAHRTYLQTVRLNVFGGIQKDSNQHVAVDEQAAYAEATYAFNSQIKLTAGGRLSSESKTGHTEVGLFLSPGVPLTPTAISGPYSKTWRSFTPKVLLSYAPTRDLFSYISATSGFESGGYDTNGSNAAELASAYKPEKVWSYEAGVKSQWFARTLTLNADVYDAEYTDLQTRNFDPITTNIVAGNAAQARVRGLELETRWALNNYLTLGAAYAYTDAKYLKYAGNSGHNIPVTPRNALNLNADIHFANPAGPGKYVIGGDVTYRSDIQFNDANDTAKYVVSRSAYKGLANLHAEWRSDGDKLEFALWIKNLTNTQSATAASDLSHFYGLVAPQAPGQSIYIVNWTPARTVGVSLTAKY